MSRRSRAARWGFPGAAAVTAGTLVAFALPVFAAPAMQPDGPLPSPRRQLEVPAAGLTRVGTEASEGRTPVFVQLAGPGAVQAAARSGGAGRVGAALDRRAQVGRTADAVVSTARAQDRRATELFRVSNAVPGVGVRANTAALRDIARRTDVVRILPLIRKTATNASAARLDRVLSTWRKRHETGEGVRIGVIDTGLDYTHADFGGPGTVAAYDAALADETNADWRSQLPALGRAKVEGGFDFVGNDYDPDSDTDFAPEPDPDPIDCQEHGTHVAGSAAGYGVTSSGETFTGRYDRLTGKRLMRMRVGPGMAPGASVFAFKVFGCEGGTLAVIPALDRALDPDGDGDFSDRLDVVNLSLGLDYGTVDDPDNIVINELARQGVLPVTSMGNNGDLTDTGGSPGNAVRTLAVASSVDAFQLRDGLRINAPTNVAGIASGQMSADFDWATRPPVTGPVVDIPGPNADGCDALSAPDAVRLSGKVAWLEWDDNDATRRCGSAARSANVKAAGAIGAVFTSQLSIFPAGIAGDAEIPVFQLTRRETDRLRPVMEAGALNVTFDGELAASIEDVDPSITDTISSFTSRGPHGSIGVVKPDVTAPGDTIASAFMGSGNDVLSISGTSMAAPHVAGITALVKGRHRDWTPEQIKAAVMNTAVHDLFTMADREGARFGPARVGAGRVDARLATRTKVLAYTAKHEGAVSASFGVVAAPVSQSTVVEKQRVFVENVGRRTRALRMSYEPVVEQPGVSYSVAPSRVTLPGHTRRKVKVTMTVTTQDLRHTIDPTMEREQLDVARQYLSDASGRLRVKPVGKPAVRVPVYGAAKPASQTSVAVDDGRLVVSGQGVDQGEGTERYRSLLSVLELGATSGNAPVCTELSGFDGCVFNRSSRAADLKYVGAGSDDEWLWFGIATHADWPTIGNTLIPFVDVDTDGDGEPDYEVQVQNLTGTDVLTAALFDLSTGAAVDVEPVNFNFGDVDTNVFDNNVMLLPVLKDAIGAPPSGSFPISYEAGAVVIGDGFLDLVDVTPVIEYDAGAPAVSTAGPLFVDDGGTVIDVAASGSGEQALVLHLHGTRGQRAEVLNLP